MSLTQKCAWCAREGIVTIIAWGDEPGESHGICAAHQTELYAEAFENYLKTHPHETIRLTGESR